MANPYGGFECDFVIKPPDRLRCAICLHVLRDPQLTSCGHHFCMSCITKAYQESQVCPVCRKTYSIFQDQRVPREVRELQVRCSNKNLGCEWVGELGSYIDEHTNQCQFVNVRCIHCQQSVPRRMMAKHQDLLCPLRKYDCVYCGNYVSTYNHVVKNHWPVCESFPVPCPNDCPKGSIPRSHLMEHIRSECKVKKEGKQIAELQEKLHDLQEHLGKRNDEAREKERRLAAEAKKKEEYRDRRITKLEELALELVNLKVQNRMEELESRMDEVQRDDGDVNDMQSSMEELEKDDIDNDGSHHSPFLQRSRAKSDLEGVREKETQEDRYSLSEPPRNPLPEVVNLLHDSDVYLEWSSCQELPEPMVDGHAILVGDFIYVGGGICVSGDIVYRYSYKNDNWSTLPKANREKFAMVCYENQLTLIGGRNLKGEYCDSLLVWDEKEHMWTDSLYPPMSTPRMLTAACSHQELIIVAGGKSGRFGSLDSVEVFDGSKWHSVAQLPVRIHSAKTAIFEKQLFIVGGDGQRKAVYCASLDILSEYHEDVQMWKTFPAAEFPYASIATFGNTLLAIGGSTAIGSTSAVRAYFAGTKTWLRVERSLPRAFCCTAVVIISPKELLLIGGCSGRIKYSHVFRGVLKFCS